MDFRVLPRGCPMELRNLVFSLEYLVFNGRQVLLGGIRLGGSATIEWLVNELMMTANKIEYKYARLVMLPADEINLQAR